MNSHNWGKNATSRENCTRNNIVDFTNMTLLACPNSGKLILFHIIIETKKENETEHWKHRKRCCIFFTSPHKVSLTYLSVNISSRLFEHLQRQAGGPAQRL